MSTRLYGYLNSKYSDIKNLILLKFSFYVLNALVKRFVKTNIGIEQEGQDSHK